MALIFRKTVMESVPMCVSDPSVEQMALCGGRSYIMAAEAKKK